MGFIPDNQGFIPDKKGFVPDKKKTLWETSGVPISKLVTGKSMGERADLVGKHEEDITSLIAQRSKEGKTISTTEAFIKGLPSAAGETLINLVDLTPRDVAIMATTGAVGKVISKLPLMGSTVGRIASKISIGKGFVKRASELGRYESQFGQIGGAVSGVSKLPKKGELAVQKVTQALKEATPIRAEQEVLLHAERSKRAANIAGIGERVPGEKGFHTQLKALKGEMPKVEYTGIRNKVGQSEIDDLFTFVEGSSELLPFEKISAKTGLAKLLGAEGVAVPTKGELKLLNQVFPFDFVKEVLNKQSLTSKLFTGAGEVLNVPRAIMASSDLSFSFRQGAFLSIRHPKEFWSAFGSQFKYYADENAYKGLMKDIRSRPTYELMRRAKLPLTDLSSPFLTEREEAFMSSFAEKIPGIGRIVHASNRAYTGMANKLRADVFDSFIKTATSQGVPITDRFLKSAGNFIGAATGRGSNKVMEEAAVLLNSTFFSPRLMASRFSLLNPIYYTKLDPFVRKKALESLFTFAGTGLTIMGMAHKAGMDVGINPLSADFGKIKIGNTRYDPWGGFSQYFRTAAQLVAGKIVSSTTDTEIRLGEGYKPMTRLDVLERFFEYKTSPMASFAIALLKGRSMGKQTLDIPLEIGKRFVPMVVQDTYDLIKERGLSDAPMAIPAMFGIGVQTYEPTARDVVYAKNTVRLQATELLNQGRKDEAYKLIHKNIKFLEMAPQLEPFHDRMSMLERMKNKISNDIRIPKEERQTKINELDEEIKSLEKTMEDRYQELKNRRGFIPDKEAKRGFVPD